jgi:cbb3-type cytochrome oxidase maturation protein
MSVLYIALPAALALAGIWVAACRWCARDGQFDDLETPAHRMLRDD